MSVRLAAITGAIVLFLAGCDWAQPGFDAGLSSYQPVEGTLTAATVPRLRQFYAVPVADSPLPQSPVVADGGVFIATCPFRCALNRHDPKTGELVWSVPVGNDAPVNLAVVGHLAVWANNVCTETCVGEVSAHDTATGAWVWTVRRPEPLNEMRLDGNRVLLAESRNADVTDLVSVVALDAANGQVLWNQTPGFWHNDHELLAGKGVVYATRFDVRTSSLSVNEYDAATGALIRNVPCVLGVLAYDTLYSNGGTACDTRTGATRWRNADAAGFTSVGPILVATGASVGAFDAATGTRSWLHGVDPSDSTATGPAAIAADVAYLLTTRQSDVHSDGRFTAYRLRDGAVLFTTVVAPIDQRTPPSIANGRIYFHARGTLYAYGV